MLVSSSVSHIVYHLKKIVDCKTDLMTWISNKKYSFAYSWPDHHQLGMQRKSTGFSLFLEISLAMGWSSLSVRLLSTPQDAEESIPSKWAHHSALDDMKWIKFSLPFTPCGNHWQNYPENIFVLINTTSIVCDLVSSFEFITNAQMHCRLYFINVFIHFKENDKNWLFNLMIQIKNNL